MSTLPYPEWMYRPRYMGLDGLASDDPRVRKVHDDIAAAVAARLTEVLEDLEDERRLDRLIEDREDLFEEECD